MTKPTTIAFYLPQFYPTPDNDAWYGAGFTEWRNVVQAQPLFEGHYQPRLPGDLGFYDLRVPETRERQAHLARASGVDAFCYYHYWFDGYRPLDRVLDDVLEHRSPDMPFCIAWANENWSRHWDASNHEILLRQTYSPEDDEAHGRFLLRVMSSPLYLKVNGRPILFIYRAQAIPDAAATLRRWRELWRAGGVDDVEIITFDTHGRAADPQTYGADSAAQFLPHGIAEAVPQLCVPEATAGNLIFDYEAIVDHYSQVEPPPWRRYECVFPSWDNTSRRGDGLSFVVHASTPELFERWLASALKRAEPDGLVLLNAWNEWAEGAYLEPDLHFGDAYLRATGRALGVVSAESSQPLAPFAETPTHLQDRFAELYLNSFESQTVLRRRLSRLEAMFDRQLAVATAEAKAEAAEWKQFAAILGEEIDRLKREAAPRRATGWGA